MPNIDPADHEKAVERMQAAADRWRDHGFDLDFAELVYLGDRNEAAAYLRDHGWQLNRQSVNELFAPTACAPSTARTWPISATPQYVSGMLEGSER